MPQAPPTTATLVRMATGAFERRSWATLRGLYHDEALLALVSNGSAPVGPDDAIASLRRSLETTSYQAFVDRVVELDEGAAVTTGSLRLPAAGGGHADSHRTWLYTAHEHLLFRVAAVADIEAGRALYAAHGASLGIR